MIYVVSFKNEHLNYNLPPGYKNIRVGEIFNNPEKDNINYMNPYINELTALYYIWKNINDDYIGMVSYRRFLRDNNTDDIIDFNICKSYLNIFNIICTAFYFSERFNLIDFLRMDFKRCNINVNILDKYYNKLIQVEPKLEEYFNTNYSFNGKHMFVANKRLIDKYCEWLFPIIIPLTEEFIKEDSSNLKGDDLRILAYLFERLLSFWLQENRLSILGLNVAEYKKWF